MTEMNLSYRFGIFAIAVLLFRGGTGLAMADLPNVVLLMGDDHGWDETGYNGHPHVLTPVLDEMAATGLRMDRFYSAHPSCSPTRGSVMTGRHPNRYGTYSPNWSMRPEEVTIAHIMSQAGYACGHFGKWHLGAVKAGSPLNPGAMGFDEWLSHDNFFELNPTLSRNGAKPETLRGESSEIVIDETIRFIKRANNVGKPFFAVVWFGSPHEPYAGIEKDLALYNDLPAEYSERTVKLTDIETGSSTQRPLRDVLRERFAEITAMDRSIGTLRKFLADSEQRENTLLWYCGDNGTPSSGNVAVPFRGEKGAVYEGGVRVPGIIEWPEKVPSPMQNSVNSVTSDMLPTLCEIVGQPLPQRPLDGISLAPMFSGKMTKRPKPICFWIFRGRSNGNGKPYIEPKLQEGTTPLVKLMAGKPTRTFRNFHHPEITPEDYGGPRTVLADQYKLVVEGSRKSPVELFDIRSDPAEKNNLAARQPEIVERMQAHMRSWQDSVLKSLTGADYR